MQLGKAQISYNMIVTQEEVMLIGKALAMTSGVALRLSEEEKASMAALNKRLLNDRKTLLDGQLKAVKDAEEVLARVWEDERAVLG